MAANCHAAAAALHLAENSAYKALVSSLNETQLEQLGEVLLAAMSESATGGANSSNAQANPHAEAVDSAFAILPNVACIEPRGRWDILFSEQAIFFRNKKGVVQKIEREKVATAVHAEIKAISGKKEHLFLLACREPVQLVGMKKQPSILGWKFPGTPVVADAPSFSRKPDTSQLRCDTATCGTVAGVAAHELDSLLGSPYQLSAWLCEGCLAPMDASNQARFTSSTGASHVQATHVVDTGCLHPLTTGLAFTSKPLLWLPFSGMESMECDQRGFGGHARYWDLKVQMKGNAAAVEFKNIAASEKDLVQAHLASAMELGGGGCEPPTGGGAAAGSSPSVPHAENASGAPAQIDDSEEEDSDFSEGGNSSEGGGGDKSGSDSGSDDSDDDSSDDGSEATFPEADDDNSVEFVEEDARDLSGAEEAVAAIAAEAAAGGGRKRSRRAAVGDAATGTDDDSDATEDESEVASKQARGLDG